MPVYWIGFPVEVGDGAPVGLMLVPFDVGALTLAKLAQAMRVLFAKCRTKERLPKKEPSPLSVEEKSSVYVAV